LLATWNQNRCSFGEDLMKPLSKQLGRLHASATGPGLDAFSKRSQEKKKDTPASTAGVVTNSLSATGADWSTQRLG
jgi:hypothetical protein